MEKSCNTQPTVSHKLAHSLLPGNTPQRPDLKTRPPAPMELEKAHCLAWDLAERKETIALKRENQT